MPGSLPQLLSSLCSCGIVCGVDEAQMGHQLSVHGFLCLRSGLNLLDDLGV